VESIAEAHVRLIRIVVVIRSQRKRCLNVLAHAASTCRSTITGSVKVNVEPCPGCDSIPLLLEGNVFLLERLAPERPFRCRRPLARIKSVARD
jgi:hypothetical protein